MKVKMGLIEKAKFCRDLAVLGKANEVELATLQLLQSDTSIFSFAKIPISEWATGTLIMLGKLKYEENKTENMDYVLQTYKDFRELYKNGTLEL